MERQPAIGSRSSTPATRRFPDRSRLSDDTALTLLLLLAASVSWWVTLRLSEDMSVGVLLFPVSWAVMMAAMMLPAVAPVARLYMRAAAAGRVAPAGFFLVGYLALWLLSGLPAYLLWRTMSDPLMGSTPWALRVAGATLVAAGLYQLSPLKRACLRHCRSPMGYFMRSGRGLGTPRGATRAGITHGTYCFGCCAGLMLVLVAAVAMQPIWALVIAGVIFVERNLHHGESFSLVFAAVLTVMGGATLIHPALAEGLIEGVPL